MQMASTYKNCFLKVENANNVDNLGSHLTTCMPKRQAAICVLIKNGSVANQSR